MKLSMIAAGLLLALPLSSTAADGPALAGSSATPAAEPELADIIKAYARRTGKKFIIDPRVRAMGGLAGIDPDKISYQQLLALTSVHGFVAVQEGDLVVVTPDAAARQQPTPVYTDMRFKALDDEWVTLLLGAKRICVANIVPILRPLMPQAAHLAANPQSNQLLITDRAVNARRIATLVEKLDDATPAGRTCADLESSK